MGEGEAGHVLIFNGKFREDIEQIDKLLADEQHRLAHDNNIGVVADIAGGRAEVDYRLGVRALHAVGVNMGHNIVTNFFFAGGGDIIVYVVLVRFEFGYLLVRYVEPELLFALCESYPEPAPCSEFEVRREDIFHSVARVAGVERGFIGVFHVEPILCRFI